MHFTCVFTIPLNLYVIINVLAAFKSVSVHESLPSCSRKRPSRIEFRRKVMADSPVKESVGYSKVHMHIQKRPVSH